MPERKIGKFEIIEKLRSGGMGDIYLARNPDLDTEVVIKVLKEECSSDPDLVERFRSEPKKLMKLRSENVVTVFDAGTHDGTPYFAMEFLDGQSLDKLLQSKSLTHEQKIDLLGQVLNGVCVAHDLGENGIVHRDLKPENVMVLKKAGGLQAVVVDFGIAKDMDMNSLTRGKQLFGTPYYMAPEQCMIRTVREDRGLGIDKRTDIYSLGILIYEMLTGKLPYEADTFEAIINAHIDPDVEPVKPSILDSSITAEQESLILKCMEKDPGDRYQDINELISDFQRCFSYEMARNAVSGTIVKKTNMLRDTIAEITGLSGKASVLGRAIRLVLAFGLALLIVYIIQPDWCKDNLCTISSALNISSELSICNVQSSREAAAANSRELSPNQYELGIGYLRDGEYEKAVEAFSKIVDTDPDNADVWLKLAQSNLGATDIENARKAVERAMELSPDSGEALLVRGQIEDSEGEYLMAVMYYRKASRQSPDNAEIYRSMAVALEKMGNNAESADIWEQFLLLKPGDKDAEAIMNHILELRR